MQAMKKHIDKYKLSIYLLSTIIPIIVALIGLIKGGFAPFGNENVLGASGNSDFLPYFYELYDRVHEHTLTAFSKTVGLGYDFTSLVTYHISDPINFLILLVPRDYIPVAFNMIYALKIGLSGLSMSVYLTYHNEHTKRLEDIDEEKLADKKNNKDEKEKKDIVLGSQKEPTSKLGKFIRYNNWLVLAFSIAYALSATMVAIGMNIAYLSAMAIFPIIIMGMDKIINDEKPYVFIISYALSFFFNMHIATIISIFLPLYFISRSFDSISNFVRALINTLLSSLLAIAMAGIILINSIQGTFFREDISILFPNFEYYNPMDSVKQLMSRMPVSMYSFYANHIDISFGILFIFGIILYCFSKNDSPFTRIKNIILWALLFSGTVITSLRYFFNGMSLNAGNEIHFAFIIAFLGIIMSFDAIRCINSFKTIHIVVTGLLTIGIMVASMTLSTMYDNQKIYLLSFEFIFIYFITSFILVNKSMTKALYIQIIALVLIIECIPGFINNEVTLGKGFNSLPVYKDYKYQTYETSKYIHSLDKDAAIKYVSRENNYSHPLTTTMSGYKYVISLTHQLDDDNTIAYIDDYVPEKSVNGLSIYQNPYPLVGSIYPRSVSTYSYDKFNPFISTNNLVVNYLGYPMLFTEIPAKTKAMESSDNSYVNFTFKTEETGNIYVQAISLSHYISDETNSDNSVIQLAPIYRYTYITYNYHAALFNMDSYSKILGSLYMDSYQNINEINKETNINSPVEGYISTGLPMLKSLRYYVNEKEVTPVELMEGNALLPIQKGNNIINIEYNNEYLSNGLIITIISLLVLILLIISERKELLKDLKVVKENTTNACIDHLKKYYVYYATILIITILTILCMIINACYPFGKKTMVLGDGTSQAYADKLSLIYSTRNGIPLPFFRFDIGSFRDTYSSFTLSSLKSPWNILKRFIIPDTLTFFDFTYGYVLILLLSPITFIFYLTHRYEHRFNSNDSRLIIIGLLYGLSSYCYSFFIYAGFNFTLYIPILILGLEQLIYRNKPSLYVCMLVLLIIGDQYHAFLACEFLLLYFFTYNFKSIKDLFTKGIRFALYSILSALLSLPFLVQMFGIAQKSAYSENDSKIPSIFSFWGSYAKLISNYRIGYTTKDVSSDNMQAAIYCGYIVLICIILFALCKNIDINIRIKKIVLLLLLYISFNNELLNYLLHGMHYQTMVPNRYAYFFIFIGITMLCDILINIDKINKYKILICTTGISTLLLITYLFNKDITKTSLIISILFLSILTISCLIVSFIKKYSSKALFNMMLYISVAEICINFVYEFPLHIGGSDTILDEINYISDISDNIPDMKNFYNNTEYLGKHLYLNNIGALTDMNTISYFYNKIDSNTNEWNQYYNVFHGINNNDYNNGNPLADMMLHLKYHVENIYDESAFSPYSLIYKYRDYNVYENPYYTSFGFVINDTDNGYKNLKTTPYDLFKHQNELTQYMCNKDLYNVFEENVDYTYAFGDEYEEERENTEIASFFPVTITIKNDYNGPIYIGYYSSIYCIGTVDKNNRTLYVDLPKQKIDKSKEKEFQIASVNYDNQLILKEKLCENTLYDLKQDGRNIYGKVDSTNDGILYFSLPYYEGWEIYVDNVKVDKIKYLGSMGVYITKGSHDIRMEYHPQGRILGNVSVIITILLLGMILWLVSKKKKQEM